MAQGILEKLAKQREQLIAVVGALPEEAMERAVEGEWSIRDCLTHLANAEEDHCRVIAVAVRGDGARLPASLDLDEHNRQRLAQRGRLERDDILAAMAAQRERTEALFNRLSEEQLELAVRHPALGDMTVAKIFRIIGLHEKMHLKEIEAAL